MISALQIFRSPAVLGTAGATLLAIAAPHAVVAAPAGPFTVNVGGDTYKIITTDPINYLALSTLSGGVYSGYSYDFTPLDPSALAKAFYNQISTTPVNTAVAGSTGSAEQPAIAPNPNRQGGPLFFTNYNAPNPPFSTNSSATGSYFVVNPSSTPFTSYQGGNGIVAQTHIWAMWKKAANDVPGHLPIFGAAAAFGYSRRLRKRVRTSQA
jgi:hypothetical protein